MPIRFSTFEVSIVWNDAGSTLTRGLSRRNGILATLGLSTGATGRWGYMKADGGAAFGCSRRSGRTLVTIASRSAGPREGSTEGERGSEGRRLCTHATDGSASETGPVNCLQEQRQCSEAIVVCESG